MTTLLTKLTQYIEHTGQIITGYQHRKIVVIDHDRILVLQIFGCCGIDLGIDLFFILVIDIFQFQNGNNIPILFLNMCREVFHIIDMGFNDTIKDDIQIAVFFFIRTFRTQIRTNLRIDIDGSDPSHLCQIPKDLHHRGQGPYGKGIESERSIDPHIGIFTEYGTGSIFDHSSNFLLFRIRRYHGNILHCAFTSLLCVTMIYAIIKSYCTSHMLCQYLNTA